jgi:hypothetical protein
MAKIFGIEETDFDTLPDEIKNALRNAQTDQEARDARLAAIEAKLNGDGGGDDKNKNNNQPANKWGIDAGTEMLLQNRCDMILMRLLNDSDQMVKTAVKLFEKEIRDNLELSNPNYRAQEPFVRNVIDMVKGRHMAEIIADINKAPGERKYGDFFVEGASGGNNNRNPQKSLAERLTNEQCKAAKLFGITDEDYAKELDSMGALGA